MRGRGNDVKFDMRKVLANAGWMLGGQGFTAVMSLVYLGLATRSLGLSGFGTFSMILAVSQAVGTLVAFQCWQIVVHYGVDHLREGRDDDLSRLLWFCAGLDFAGAAAGSVISVMACLALGHGFGWSDTTTWQAAAFCLATMLGIRSTPVGVMRLHDRYALSTGAEAVAPAIKAAGAVVAWYMDLGLPGFLAVWGLAEICVSAAYWALACTVCGAPWRIGARPQFRGVAGANAGLWRYAIATNATSSLRIGSKSLAILIVGAVAGQAAAGAYRICLQLSQASAKVTQIVSRAVFPELARARLTGVADLRAVMMATTKMVGIFALASAMLLPLLGPFLIDVVGGHAYAYALPALYVMGAASTIDMVGTALEPTLFTLGRPGAAFRANAVATALTVGLMVPLSATMGATGSAGAVLAGSIVAFAMMALTARSAFATRKATPAVAEIRTA
jgi:O-antigen/teichoic acid export membrane protein